MNIAVVLTGHSREFDKTFPKFKEIFEKYNADVYFNTWDVNEYSINSLGKFNLAKHPVDKDSIIQKLKPYLVNYNFESWDDYEKNRFSPIQFLDRADDVFKINERAIYHGSYWVERLRDQWWVVKKAWNLIDDPYKYDLIFRTRFDLQINTIQFKKAKFVVPKSEVEFYKIGTNWSDHMAYGEPDTMEKYCNMFDHIESLYKDYNIDISHAEQLNEFYMKNYGKKVECFVDMDIIYTKASEK